LILDIFLISQSKIHRCYGLEPESLSEYSFGFLLKINPVSCTFISYQVDSKSQINFAEISNAYRRNFYL